MTLFQPRARREKRVASLDTLEAILRQHGITPRSSSSSVGAITADTAMRLSAVWACVALICDQCSTLPFDEFRRVQGGWPVEVVPRSRLVDEPSALVDVLTWRYQFFESLVLRGNTYGWVTEMDPQMWPTRIELLDPDVVTWMAPRKPGGEWASKVAGEAVERWPSGRLWHVPGRTMAGCPIGLSPIKYAMERIRLGLTAERFGTDWFDDGAHPSALLEFEDWLDDSQAKVAKTRFVESTRGAEPAVLSGGVKYTPIQVSAEESQFLETIQANVADIARFFLVPPEMIGGASSDSLTYANVEGRSLHLRQYTLNPWLVRCEAALTRSVPRPRYVKLNRDAIVAVDLTTRYKAHDLGIRAGWLSRNDVRDVEDKPPIDGGDMYLWPPYSTAPVAPPAPEPAGARAAKVFRIVRDADGRAVALSNGDSNGSQ
jgi:HK97 family phage portal protein